ncbi:glycosyltransferase family 2 protein [Candidatus Magnetaquicoccus inordinatus]|uniref:glycosyltransferase family 2 protein n=1 Tax=Candidatus Magnetaquicoccus inordinatus TaxID=2496818 RepID=UPI00102CAF3E|nr:glycosyltransferase family A protein [Candidatus Magnetaquicoccus inordinatus]
MMPVSVLIPVKNGAAYLPEALESVLAQGSMVNEIVVVDDGSSDDSGAIARRFAKVRCLRLDHSSGISAARNLALAQAEGPLVAFLDADDRWISGWLRAAMRALEEHVGSELFFGQMRQFISPDAPIELCQRLRVPPGWETGYVPSALLTRLSTFARVGGFDSRWRRGEFIDWLLRAREMGCQEVMVGVHAVERRLHLHNHGRTQQEAAVDYARIVLAQRRRQQQSGGGSP